MGIPGIVVVHDYDRSTKRFRGLLIRKEDNDVLVFIEESNVSGAVLTPRNRMLELLSKEATLSLLLEQNTDLIDKALDILRQETDRLRKRVETR